MAEAYLSSDLEEQKNEILKMLSENVPDYYIESVRSSLDNWEKTPLNIGVTGRSGVGKSSFINTIRGLTGECPGAAPTDVIETTREAVRYPHPNNKNLILWDLPGMGTGNFPKDSYFEDPRVQFGIYDMFLIVSSDRFYEDDYLLAKTAHESGKLFLFIRSKVDAGVESQRKSKPTFFQENRNAEEDLLNKMRGEVVNGLEQNGLPAESSVFLINCLSSQEYEFPKLLEVLIQKFSGVKRDVFIMSLTNLNSGVLAHKVAVLRGRIWKVSALSAAGAVVPIPDFSMAVDSAIILKETLFYMKQLGITKEDVEKASKAFSMDPAEFQAKLDMKTAVLSWAVNGMAQILCYVEASEVAECAVKFALPVFGSVIASCTSFASTAYILSKTLNMMAIDAQKLHEFALKHVRSN